MPIKPTGTPYHRIDELRQKKVELEKRIRNGESGDGYSKPNLHAELSGVIGELQTYMEINPEVPITNRTEALKRLKRMYPKMER